MPSASTHTLPAAAPGLAPGAVHVRKARLQDARNIFDLVNSFAHDGTLLRRSYAELCENIRDFTIAERLPSPHDESIDAAPTALEASATPGSALASFPAPSEPFDPAGTEPEFLGCGALHLYGPHLAEVRSIVVRPDRRGLGAGDAILEALVDEAELHQVLSVCLFTRIPGYFEHLGFRVAERDAMPDKIYKDCQTCPRLYACDEVAMVRGPLPKVAVLGPNTVQRPELVQLQLASTGTGR